MRILGLEVRKARPYGERAIKRMREEPRTRSATMKFTYGDVRGNIYSPFDDETGETQWRFSLVKLCGDNEDGTQVVRKSFTKDDEKDLYYAITRCVHYISNAEKL